MTTVTVTPAEINAQHGKPVLLIDIRSHDEWRREHISGTRSLPLEQLHAGCFSETGLSETDTVIASTDASLLRERWRPALTVYLCYYRN